MLVMAECVQALSCQSEDEMKKEEIEALIEQKFEELKAKLGLGGGVTTQDSGGGGTSNPPPPKNP
jgi:hypothetical protein